MSPGFDVLTDGSDDGKKQGAVDLNQTGVVVTATDVDPEPSDVGPRPSDVPKNRTGVAKHPSTSRRKGPALAETPRRRPAGLGVARTPLDVVASGLDVGENRIEFPMPISTVKVAAGYISGMGTPPRRPRVDIPAPLRERLTMARDALLGVHKALLDEEKIRYERARGRIENNYQLLQLVISDPWFAWLHPVSELVVQIDVFMEAREPAPPGTAESLLRQARTLLTPDDSADEFHREYRRALQESPAVVVAHSDALKGLGPAVSA